MRVAVATLLALAAACADGGTTPTVRCEAACERHSTCNMASSSPFCDPDCPERLQALLPEFRDAFLECHIGSRCDDEEIDCEVEASSAVERRPIDDNYLDQCQTAQTSCEEGFDVDYCFVSRYYQEEAVERAYACFSTPCQGIEVCLGSELPLAPF